MKKVVLRFGAWSSLFMLIFFVLTWLVIDISHVEHDVQGDIGYVAIICPLLFVYFGIRYYRDKVNGGSISFLTALKLGMLIIILPTISFAIIETVYVFYIDPKFYENLAAYDLEQCRKVLSPAQYALKLKEVNDGLQWDKSLINNFGGMILTIGALGSVVSVFSSLLVMRKAKKVAA
jgi:Protein of unknown function (DUF4199)